MLEPLSTSFGNMILALSDSIDLASPEIATHQLRVAYVTWQLAEAAGLPKKRTEDLFIAALFHDIGALSLEDKILIHRSELQDVAHHCLLGESLFELYPALFGQAKDSIRFHHTPWSAWKVPIDRPLAFDSQLLHLADFLERSIDRQVYILEQSESLDSEVLSCSGDELHPDIIALYMGLSKRESFWLDLVSSKLYNIMLNYGPLRGMRITTSDVLSIAKMFSHIIDFKSRFTATHSTGVAECATILAKIYGIPEDDIARIRIAAFFHDLGKLSVPNAILDKPGALTKAEFAVMRQHTYHTHSTLSAIGGLERIPEWASFHHERLDGSGYPFHVTGDRISLEARMLAISDIFTALSEDRPYRPGMGWKEIEALLYEHCAKSTLDKGIVKFIVDDHVEIRSKIKAVQERSEALFMEKFSRADRGGIL